MWYVINMDRGQRVKAAYEKGKKDREKYGDLNTWAYDNNAPTWDDLLDASWKAGWDGRDCPVQASGWRYGDVPASGKSYNYRDQRPEPGISMMYIKTVDGIEYGTRDKVSAVFVRDRRNRVEVSGWLVGFGSDGEPCILR